MLETVNEHSSKSCRGCDCPTEDSRIPYLAILANRNSFCYGLRTVFRARFPHNPISTSSPFNTHV